MIFTKANGLKKCITTMEGFCQIKDIFIKDIGKMAYAKEKDLWLTKMVTFTMEIGKRESTMVLEHLYRVKVTNMKAIGLKINKKVLERSFGQMDHILKENTKMARKMDLENLNGQIMTSLKECL